MVVVEVRNITHSFRTLGHSKCMLRDPREHQMDGFGEWEFGNLLGAHLVV